MDILFLLVPISVGLVFALMAVFAWALRSGQFDDLRDEGERILGPDRFDAFVGSVRPGRPNVDEDQAAR